MLESPPFRRLVRQRWRRGRRRQLTDLFISAKKQWMVSEGMHRRSSWLSARPPKGLIALALLGMLGLVSASVLAVPAEVRVPIVKEHGKADPPEAGMFSHWNHDQYLCFTCHPSLFPRARKGFTHDEMDEGKFCGACHDGHTAPPASGARATCKTSCHAK